jgi:hypothetical protein
MVGFAQNGGQIMRYAPLTIAATIFAFTSATHAADTDQKYSNWGSGNVTCKAYSDMAAAQNADFDRASAWMAGYVTAYNRLSDKTYDIIAKNNNVSSVMLWLLRYCNEHNSDLLDNAAEAFTTQNMSQRQVSHP